MFAFYNGKTVTKAPCQSYRNLSAGYRYKIKSFYAIGNETFVELEGIDNRMNSLLNPGFNLDWFSIKKPVLAFCRKSPERNTNLEIEMIKVDGYENFSKNVIKVLDVEQISVDTYEIFADDYMSYIVQVID